MPWNRIGSLLIAHQPPDSAVHHQQHACSWARSIVSRIFLSELLLPPAPGSPPDVISRLIAMRLRTPKAGG